MELNEVLHANIFFIIASVGVVIFIVLTSLILYHVLKVVRAVRRIISRVERGSEVLAEDIEDLHRNLNPSRLLAWVASFIPGGKR